MQAALPGSAQGRRGGGGQGLGRAISHLPEVPRLPLPPARPKATGSQVQLHF